MSSTVALVEQARGGDREAFDRLFARAADRLLLFVRLRLGAGLAAALEPEDVLQETYLRAVRDFASFEPRGRGAFVAWLCRIAERRIRDLADHHGAAKRKPPGGLAGADALAAARASITGPLTALRRGEAGDRLADALERLDDPDERRAILLRFFEDRTLDEVAAELDRSPTAVRRLLGKAMARLARELGS